MLFDCHVHSTASPDGKMTAEEVIRLADKQQMGIIFTEHVDLDPQGKPLFCVDFETYPREYVRYKSDKILLGIEIGLIPECADKNRSIAGNPDYDYILGSVHATDGIDIGYDPGSFFAEGTGCYARHLHCILEMVKTNDFFDALGHIDYISRYSPFIEKNVLYGDYAELYDEILTALIEGDKLLEFCSRRLGDGEARKNLFTIFSRYRDLGGRYVTLGSDAHVLEQLGYNFGTAIEMLDAIGLAPVYFNKRRMILC